MMTEAQSEHLASIDWQRGKWADAKGKYSREHTWWLAGGAKFKASDAYFLLPEGYRDGAKIDPEKMFVVTIASAHMLSWLHLAFGMGSEVLAYSDEAHGVMTELSEGVLGERNYFALEDYVQRTQSRDAGRGSSPARTCA
jgi:hypothetical protein